jgi:hypothetical protein
MARLLFSPPPIASRPILGLGLVLGLSFLNSCGSFGEAPTSLNQLPGEVRRLMGQPQTLAYAQTEASLGSTLYVQGRVVKHAPLLSGSLYQIEDSTGQLWIRSAESPPSLGSSVDVRGTLQQQSIPFQGREIGDRYLLLD